MTQNALFRRTLCSLQIRLAAPHSRKASLATPRKLCGVFAYVPAAVSTRRKKYGRSPRSSFCHFVPKLSRCSLIFAPRGWRLPPPVLFLQGRAGFVLSHGPDLHLSLTRFLTPAENQRFSPGDPVAPCVSSARRSADAKCAIPSLRSLQIRSHRDPPKRATAECAHNLWMGSRLAVV